jgi:hypothetical protein
LLRRHNKQDISDLCTRYTVLVGSSEIPEDASDASSNRRVFTRIGKKLNNDVSARELSIIKQYFHQRPSRLRNTKGQDQTARCSPLGVQSDVGSSVDIRSYCWGKIYSLGICSEEERHSISFAVDMRVFLRNLRLLYSTMALPQHTGLEDSTLCLCFRLCTLGCGWFLPSFLPSSADPSLARPG